MNYYKALNKDMKHYNMTYREGLNVDVLPFNPSGSCEEGGLYFSREHILRYLWTGGYWLAKVTIPEGEQIYQNPGDDIKWKAHKIILSDIRKITNDLILELIEEGANEEEVNCWYCTGLTELHLPKAKIVNCRSCTGLTKLNLPEAKEVDCWECTGLKKLTAPKAKYIDCQGCPDDIILNVPDDCEIIR